MHVLFKVALILMIAIPMVVALVASVGLQVFGATAPPPEDSSGRLISTPSAAVK
jgi:hypothetical protein